MRSNRMTKDKCSVYHRFLLQWSTSNQTNQCYQSVSSSPSHYQHPTSIPIFCQDLLDHSTGALYIIRWWIRFLDVELVIFAFNNIVLSFPILLRIDFFACRGISLIVIIDFKSRWHGSWNWSSGWNGYEDTHVKQIEALIVGDIESQWRSREMVEHAMNTLQICNT